MRLLIVRHADPDYATDTITEHGQLEAKALAQRLKAAEINRLYCSPMGRAIATAQYSSDALGIQAVVEPWTTEVWESHKLEQSPWGEIGAWDLPGAVLRTQEPFPTGSNWPHMDCLGKRGETIRAAIEQIRVRSDEFLSRHGYVREGKRYRCARPNRDRVAVVCHGGFGLCWLALLLEIPLPLMWAGFWLPTTSVTTVLFDERTEEWAAPRCLAVGDTAHLYHAALPVRPRGILANYD